MLPTPCQIRQSLALSTHQQQFIQQSRIDIQNILQGLDSRLLIIVGPCSIHDFSLTIEYCERLSHLVEKFKDRFFIVMRMYYEKPRTSLGWRGFVNDPDLDQSYQITKGLKLTRELLLYATELKVPCATEFLDPFTCPYLEDIISWGCIGARTVYSPLHRQLASSLTMPIGFKNSTEGSIEAAAQAMMVAKGPHSFISFNQSGQLGLCQSQGNAYTHLVLRGSDKGSNYDPSSIYSTISRLQQLGLNSRLIVDCSHDNSRRIPLQQGEVFNSLLQFNLEYPGNLCGLMLEGNLLAGNQPISSNLQYGLSITDPCMSWEMTEQLLQAAYEYSLTKSHGSIQYA